MKDGVDLVGPCSRIGNAASEIIDLSDIYPETVTVVLKSIQQHVGTIVISATSIYKKFFDRKTRRLGNNQGNGIGIKAPQNNPGGNNDRNAMPQQVNLLVNPVRVVAQDLRIPVIPPAEGR